MLSVPFFVSLLACASYDEDDAEPQTTAPPADREPELRDDEPERTPRRSERSPRDRGKQKGRKGKGKAAPGGGAPVDKRCEVGGWLTHGDRDVAVFARPDLTQRVGSLRADHYYTHLVVRARTGDAMEIDDVEVRIAKDGESDGPVELSGWVPREQVSIHLEACHNGESELRPRLYSAPDLSSRVLHRYDDSTASADVVGCSGTWWRVRDGAHEGWVPNGMWCDHAQTNCLRQCKDIRR